MNRNETDAPPSPEVARAIRGFDVRRAPFYFEGNGSSLVLELARRFRVPAGQISVGYGAEFFLREIFDACRPGKDTVFAAAPHYRFYADYPRAKGVRFATVALADRGDRFEFDIPATVAHIRSTKPKVAIIASPNNPTGNTIGPDGFEKIVRAAGRNTLVVLDEAYWGFDDTYDETAFLRLLKKYENVVMLRTFSKRYALAGLRIGFALWGTRAKKIINYQDLYLGGSRLLEEIAGAALRSEAYYKKLAHRVMVDRDSFIREVNKLQSFRAYASSANFALVKVGKKAIPKLKRVMASEKVSIAKFVAPELVRVSLGSHPPIAAFVNQLSKIDGEHGRHV